MCKFLGFSIDCKLNWEKHVQNTESKVSKVIYLLRGYTLTPVLKA